MIEVYYDVIKAVAGQQIDVTVDIEGEVEGGCQMVIHNAANDIVAATEGSYIEEVDMWHFTFPADATKGLEGRFWYCVQNDGQNLCFKQPMYLRG